MALKLVLRVRAGRRRESIFYVRGMMHGIPVYQSTQTTDRASAEIVRLAIERRMTVDAFDAWRSIPGHDAYEVTRDGRIRRAVSADLSQKPSRYGYPTVQLSRAGRPVWVSVHRAVALAYLGPPPRPDAQVCHRDGNKQNCRIENLYWGTPAQNGADKRRHNLALSQFEF